MKVIISGMAGVGKSTLAQAIARRYGLKIFSGGDLLKEKAKEFGYNSIGNFWWETRKGLDFLKRRLSDGQFDKELDRKIKTILNGGNVVVTALTMSWKYKNDKCIKIWLKAPQEIRAKRVMTRDKIAFGEALKAVKERDENNKKLFLGLYNIQLEHDLTPFDVVLDTQKLSAQDVETIIFHILDIYARNGSTTFHA